MITLRSIGVFTESEMIDFGLRFADAGELADLGIGPYYAE